LANASDTIRLDEGIHALNTFALVGDKALTFRPYEGALTLPQIVATGGFFFFIVPELLFAPLI